MRRSALLFALPLLVLPGCRMNERMTGTNTQHLRPTPAQLEELTALRERLRR